MLYNWGYSNYNNPYYGGSGYGGTNVVQQPIVYNYAQPIDATAPPPEDSVTTQAMTTFDQARETFKQGDYSRALDLTDQCFEQVPNDPTLHEFRARPVRPRPLRRGGRGRSMRCCRSAPAGIGPP